MKKLILILLLGASCFARDLEVKYEQQIEVTGINPEVGTICRKGLQWVIIDGGYKSALALDQELIDKNVPSKGTKPVVCDY